MLCGRRDELVQEGVPGSWGLSSSGNNILERRTVCPNEKLVRVAFEQLRKLQNTTLSPAVAKMALVSQFQKADVKAARAEKLSLAPL